MTNKHGTNGVNEELPEEHEVIQHGLQESSDKGRQEKPLVKKGSSVRKADSSRPAKADSSSSRETEKR